MKKRLLRSRLVDRRLRKRLPGSLVIKRLPSAAHYTYGAALPELHRLVAAGAEVKRGRRDISFFSHSDLCQLRRAAWSAVALAEELEETERVLGEASAGSLNSHLLFSWISFSDGSLGPYTREKALEGQRLAEVAIGAREGAERDWLTQLLARRLQLIEMLWQAVDAFESASKSIAWMRACQRTLLEHPEIDSLRDALVFEPIVAASAEIKALAEGVGEVYLPQAGGTAEPALPSSR